jgi:hypothetical protein
LKPVKEGATILTLITKAFHLFIVPPLRQIIEVLQQVMCTHDAEKLAMAVLETYKGG